MDIAAFHTSQAKLAEAGLLKVSTLGGLLTVAAELAFSALLVWGLLVGPLWSIWLLAPLMGLSLFHWFVIVHECGHGTLFRSRFGNTLAGHVASAFCLIPYVPWREVHRLHHRWVGVIDKDPTQAGLLRLRGASAGHDRGFRIVWALWLPIPFCRFLWDTYWAYPLQRLKAGDRPAALAGALSAAVCLIALGAIILAAGPLRWLMAFAPAYAVFLIIIENITIPQHAEFSPYVAATHPTPIPYADQDVITRSSHMPDLASALLALNFNRHTEHHLYPRAPWFALNRVRRALRDDGYSPPHEVPFPGFILKFRRRDPLVIYRDSLPDAPA